MKPTIRIRPAQPVKELGDLFGLFFEDLNHAADGGLYPEMVQNRSFEFCELDRKEYHALTAWEPIGAPTLAIEKDAPVHPKDYQYLHLSGKKGEGLRNLGFAGGMPITAGEAYIFSVWSHGAVPLTLRLMGGEEVLAEASWQPAAQWAKTEITLTAASTADAALEITLADDGEAWIDDVSLMPADTFCGRRNGLRKDIATALAEMKPRFLRFPGGCLTHDGKLDKNARDGIYWWKNTVGPLEARGARRNGWQYNQTFGLGFYEYFCFCEDIGAKALPVVSGGCDPHHWRFAEGEELQGFIDDALDLIEFANGPVDSTWGRVRAEMGHPESFHLEYIGVGNEEVHQEFFDRIPLFVEAIRQKYPEIKIIGTSGPFAAGGEYERGWKSARETAVDLVDEHFYMSPDWFLSHMNRYDAFDPNGPKVFLGEYATWGNRYENALAEAAFMTHLQNAPAVGLACYAPMLANVNYVNWRPDMVYFDNRRLVKTANYHVQSLFMRHQGDQGVQMALEGVSAAPLKEIPVIAGDVTIQANDSTLELTDITLNGEALADTAVSGQNTIRLGAHTGDLTLTLKARRVQGRKGMKIFFGGYEPDNAYQWGFGGWENQDSIVEKKFRKLNASLTQSAFTIEDGRTYELRLELRGRVIRTYIDGEMINEIDDPVLNPDHLYAAASIEEGDLILKAVNVHDSDLTAQVVIEGYEDAQLVGMIESIESLPRDAMNVLGEEEAVTPAVRDFAACGTFTYTFPARSITVIRLHR